MLNQHTKGGVLYQKFLIQIGADPTRMEDPDHNEQVFETNPVAKS